MGDRQPARKAGTCHELRENSPFQLLRVGIVALIGGSRCLEPADAAEGLASEEQVYNSGFLAPAWPSLEREPKSYLGATYDRCQSEASSWTLVD